MAWVQQCVVDQCGPLLAAALVWSFLSTSLAVGVLHLLVRHQQHAVASFWGVGHCVYFAAVMPLQNIVLSDTQQCHGHAKLNTNASEFTCHMRASNTADRVKAASMDSSFLLQLGMLDRCCKTVG